MLLAQKHFSAAQALEPDVSAQRDGQQLAELGAILRAIGPDPHQATTAQRAALLDLAFGEQGERSAGAWGVLRSLGALDSLPVPVFPGQLRSQWSSGRSRAEEAYETVLGVYPDPAADRANITYPLGMEQGVLEVFDAQGALACRLPLGGTPAFKELDVRGLSPGLYMVRLLLDGHRMGEAKFTIAR